MSIMSQSFNCSHLFSFLPNLLAMIRPRFHLHHKYIFKMLRLCNKNFHVNHESKLFAFFTDFWIFHIIKIEILYYVCNPLFWFCPFCFAISFEETWNIENVGLIDLHLTYPTPTYLCTLNTSFVTFLLVKLVGSMLEYHLLTI